MSTTQQNPKQNSKQKPQRRTDSATMQAGSRIRFLARPIFLVPVGIALVVIFAAVIYYSSAKIWYREARQARVLESQLEAVETYNSDLEQNIASLETTAGIADYARAELNLVEKGEHVVVVTQNGKPLDSRQEKLANAINAIPKTARPFGSWTPFLDALFQIKQAQNR